MKYVMQAYACVPAYVCVNPLLFPLKTQIEE